MEIAIENMSDDQKRTSGARSRVRRALRVSMSVFAWVLVAVGAVLVGAASWIRRTFGPISVDQMLMNLQGAEGVGGTAAESGYVESFVWQAIVLPLSLVISVFAIMLVFAGIRRLQESRVHGESLGLPSTYESSAPRKVSIIRKLTPAVASIAVLAIGVSNFSQAVELPQYLRAMVSPLSMNDYYVAPLTEGTDVQIAMQSDQEEAPLNLVTIYLESVEDPLGDESLFEESLLEALESRTENWAQIPRMQQYNGGGWTMAGLVGMECGVPLRGAGIGEKDINSNEIGAEADSFLSGAVCLGDVLNDSGYTSVFLGGADAQFASKERFLRGHGYDEVKDLRTWHEMGETEFSAWGLSDRALFELARTEIASLNASSEPFHLSLLTLDSHEPAHLFDYCQPRNEDPLADAFRCSIEQVAGFVDFLEAEGYLENTVVIVVGDHKKMLAEGGHMWDELSDVEDRTIFNRFWSPNKAVEMREGQDQLTVFATTLELLGLGREDRRAGIAVSALVGATPVGSVAEMGPEKYEELIQSRSADLYQRLWGVGDGDQFQAVGAG
ncbi:sulfatase-like hydrolase/transferase [Leucobacter sp. W1478]|uniref:sulfatase-like hydrolase/transferase n=1 Tax=Leucobacter sp. W1478 TaxID=3439065 RepID=UPI003F4183F1